MKVATSEAALYISSRHVKEFPAALYVKAAGIITA